MAIAPSRLSASRFFRLNPNVLLSVEHSQAAVILLAIVSAEDVQFLLIESRGMVLDLRCAADHRCPDLICSYVILLCLLAIVID